MRHKTALLAASALALAAAAVGFRSQDPAEPAAPAVRVEPVVRGDGARSGPAAGRPYPRPDTSPAPHPGERWTRAVADLLGP
ncbi:hypothetical protein [Streptomyces sp. NPDC058701]|uniref:hypothetical protein n=1 Tax=Streptomyces sp. NPDC058701 TaxID=3346608 RepID=UPI0036694491